MKHSHLCQRVDATGYAKSKFVAEVILGMSRQSKNTNQHPSFGVDRWIYIARAPTVACPGVISIADRNAQSTRSSAKRPSHID